MNHQERKSSDAVETQFGDHELFSTPVLETGDPEWKWIESAVWVGEGRVVVEDGRVGVEYEISRVNATLSSSYGLRAWLR